MTLENLQKKALEVGPPQEEQAAVAKPATSGVEAPATQALPAPRPVATPVRARPVSTDAQPNEQHAWNSEFGTQHTEETLVVQTPVAHVDAGPSSVQHDDSDDDSVLIGDIDPAPGLRIYTYM